MDEGGGVGVEDEVGAELEAGMDAVAERGVVGAEEGEGSGGFWGGGGGSVVHCDPDDFTRIETRQLRINVGPGNNTENNLLSNVTRWVLLSTKTDREPICGQFRGVKCSSKKIAGKTHPFSAPTLSHPISSRPLKKHLKIPPNPLHLPPSTACNIIYCRFG